MNKWIIGLIIAGGLLLVAFTVTFGALFIKSKSKGMSTTEAAKEAIKSEMESIKSAFGGAHPPNNPITGPGDEYDSKQGQTHSYAFQTGAMQGYRPIISSYDRGAQPPIFDNAAKQPTTLTDLNVPGAEAYDAVAAEAFFEDLESMENQRIFEDSEQFLGDPITDNLFRYVDGYKITADDPWLSGPMHRVPIGQDRNVGQTIHEHDYPIA